MGGGTGRSGIGGGLFGAGLMTWAVKGWNDYRLATGK